MAFTRNWDTNYESTPPDGQAASQGATRIRELKLDIRERLAADHHFGDSEDTGNHKQVSLIDAAGDRANLTGHGRVYAKTVSGNIELMYRSDGGIIQLTQAGKLKSLSDIVAQTNTWTKAQTVQEVNLGTESGSVATDANNGNVFFVGVTANITLANPTNLVAGQTLMWVLHNVDNATHSLSYGSKFKFPNGQQIGSIGNNEEAVISGVYSGQMNRIYCSIANDMVSA